jgi:hypothetical protein
LGLTLACFGLLPKAHAQDPDAPGTPDAILALGNTSFGDGALVGLTTGVWNSAFGFEALNHTTTGHSNTGTGLRALFSNINGSTTPAMAFMHSTGTATGFSIVLMALRRRLLSGQRSVKSITPHLRSMRAVFTG